MLIPALGMPANTAANDIPCAKISFAAIFADVTQANISLRRSVFIYGMEALIAQMKGCLLDSFGWELSYALCLCIDTCLSGGVAQALQEKKSLSVLTIIRRSTSQYTTVMFWIKHYFF